MLQPWPLSEADLQAARNRLSGRIHRTPLLHSRLLDERAGRRLWLKAESLQRSGSFKIRGAFNNLLAALETGDRRPVLALSSGNHGQAVALAARELGLAATVVMPEGSSPAKISAVKGYGAAVVTEGVSQLNREEVAAAIAAEGDMRLVHPHNDPLVIAGQASLAFELSDQLAEAGLRPAAVLAPLGGGGLLSGLLLGGAVSMPGVAVLGVEPRSGNDGELSLATGELVTLPAPPETAADGVRTLHLGSLCWEVIRNRASGVVSVTEQELAEAAVWLFTRVRIVVEPTGALAVAALIGAAAQREELPQGGDVVCVLSGGNCLPSQLADFCATVTTP